MAADQVDTVCHVAAVGTQTQNVTRAILYIKCVRMLLMHERHAVSLERVAVSDCEWWNPCQVVGWLGRHHFKLAATRDVLNAQRHDLLYG